MTSPIYLEERRIRADQCRYRYAPLTGPDGAPIEERRAPMYPDAHIEFWGRVFCDNRLYLRGIRFETFIREPYAILDALAARAAAWQEEFQPLLPSQARLARRIELRSPLGWLEAGARQAAAGGDR